MARGPTRQQVTTATRKGLQRLQTRLSKLGIETSRARGASHIEITGGSVQFAGYGFLQASNGEACLMPYIVHRDGRRNSGFTVFNQITL